MIRPIRLFPDRVLGQRCRDVVDIDERALAVAQDLLDTMRSSSHSVGIAAPQIGVPVRIFCVDVTGHPKARSCHGELVVIDPVVVAHGPAEVGREGCMSVPDLTGDVARAASLVVRGRGLDGEERTYEVDAFEARAFQHELDHLDGLLFLDRVVAGDRVYRRRTYR